MTPLQRLFVLFMCLLGGCTIHSVDEEAPLLEVEVPPSFSESATGAVLPSDWDYSWWETFKDEDLNRLVESGLASNFGLQQYVARIEQAAALARRAGARLYPSLDLDAGYELQWDGETARSDSRDRKDAANLGLLLRWELDIWGRLSSLRRAENLAAQATIEDWLGARLLLSSAIAESYFEIQEQRRQLEVILAQIEINETLHQ